jgi:hypothetical protein
MSGACLILSVSLSLSFLAHNAIDCILDPALLSVVTRQIDSCGFSLESAASHCQISHLKGDHPSGDCVCDAGLGPWKDDLVSFCA